MKVPKKYIEKIEEIRRISGLKINSFSVIKKGAESLIIEINKKWIFRFPKNTTAEIKILKRLNFLIPFSKVSPISIPEPKYVERCVIGYKKIFGEPFLPSYIEKLTKKDRLKIAKQIGLFLKTLHNYKDKRVNFGTGYLVMRQSDFQNCPKEFAEYLNVDERRALDIKLRTIAKNSLNFEKPVNIIHGDLNFNNILWDKNKKVITGILDWADLGLGKPAMDFIALADFNKNTNDQFLKDILTWYGVKNDNLFFQIKENAIIEVMNWLWFYQVTNNPNGVVRIVKKLKRILAKNAIFE